MKKQTVAKYANKIATDLQLLVRLKSADDNGYVSCVTCGCIRMYNDNMHGGHFISRARTATRLLEENIHPQCAQCNCFRGGQGQKYTLYMIDTYGRGMVDELIELSNQTTKYNRIELEELHKDIKEQIKYHKERIGA